MRTALALALLAYALTAPARPNVVVILADDMGYSDLGCYGGEIATPNLDALAAGGVRFTDFYNNARCCPSRASLLTGLYPHQAGVGHMVEDRGRPGYLGRLNDRCVTLAEVLRSAGYRTMISGKWHVGGKRPYWPIDRGFADVYSLIGGGSNYFSLDKNNQLVTGDALTPPAAGGDFYFTDAFTDHAVRMIGESKGKGEPFFLYLAYTAPHWPLHARPGDVAKYRDVYKAGWDAVRAKRVERMVELNVAKRWPVAPRDPRVPAWDQFADDRNLEAEKMAVHAAMVERMDHGVGRVFAKLKETGAWDDTLVLFLSDNGASAEEYPQFVTPGVMPGPAESFHSIGPGWAQVSNAPFRANKRSTHEGGIATPLIVSWPAAVKRGGGVSREPGHLIDVMATLVEASGAAYPKVVGGREIRPVEGRSLLAVLRGESPGPPRAIYWEHEGNKAVRSGTWKLVARHGEAWELYDVERDRGETRNVAASEPERVRAMAAEWEAWAKRCDVVPFGDVIPPKK